METNWLGCAYKLAFGYTGLGSDYLKSNSVKKGDRIKVEYLLKLSDGEIVDKSEGAGPLEFVVGGGDMIEGFDEAVVGMKLNEEKTVTVPPEKAYGTDPSAHELGGKKLIFWIKVVEIN